MGSAYGEEVCPSGRRDAQEQVRRPQVRMCPFVRMCTHTRMNECMNECTNARVFLGGGGIVKSKKPLLQMKL